MLGYFHRIHFKQRNPNDGHEWNQLQSGNQRPIEQKRKWRWNAEKEELPVWCLRIEAAISRRSSLYFALYRSFVVSKSNESFLIFFHTLHFALFVLIQVSPSYVCCTAVPHHPDMQLLITSEVNPSGVQRRFDDALTVAELKQRLVLITGVEPSNMRLELKFGDQDKGHALAATDDESTLKQLIEVQGHSVSSEPEVRLHVQDASGTSGSLLDESSVPKYEMSDEAYDKRADSLRAFKKLNKLGRFNDSTDWSESKFNQIEGQRVQCIFSSVLPITVHLK